MGRTRAALIALGALGVLTGVPSPALADPGSVMYSCSVPDGWVIIRNYGAPDFCHSIEQVTGFPIGTSLTVCESSPMPAGWAVVYSGFTLSGCSPNPNNAGYGWQIARRS